MSDPGSQIPGALHAVLPSVRCTVCTGRVSARDSQVVCERGHAFDVARQGYLNLGAPQRDARADSASMVMAREAVQASGAFDGVADALCEAAQVIMAEGGEAGADGRGALVADLAGGTGFYTAHVLGSLGGAHDATCGEEHGAGHRPTREPARGLVLDLSVPALKRAARAHPALAAVGADLTRGIPLADSSIDLIINAFGPRNGSEMRRVLRPDGACIVVAPRVDHLIELVDAAGMLRVAPHKAERVVQAMQGFAVEGSVPRTYTRELSQTDTEHLIRMGPSAHHLSDADIAGRVAALFEGTRPVVTFSVDITTFRPV